MFVVFCHTLGFPFPLSRPKLVRGMFHPKPPPALAFSPHKAAEGSPRATPRTSGAFRAGPGEETRAGGTHLGPARCFPPAAPGQELSVPFRRSPPPQAGPRGRSDGSPPAAEPLEHREAKGRAPTRCGGAGGGGRGGGERGRSGTDGARPQPPLPFPAPPSLEGSPSPSCSLYLNSAVHLE